MSKIIQFTNTTYKTDFKEFKIKDLTINTNSGLYRLHAPNGYGKTMLINFILGIYKPSSGSYFKNLKPENLILINDSYLGISNLSFEKNAKWLICDLYNVNFEKEKDKVFKKLNLELLKDEFYDKCSNGTKQKLNILPLFYDQITSKTNFIILDEIFIGLDKQTTKNLVQILNELILKNITIIIIEHNENIFEQISKNIILYHEININEKGEYNVRKINKKN